jgi:ribosomal protein L34E
VRPSRRPLRGLEGRAISMPAKPGHSRSAAKLRRRRDRASVTLGGGDIGNHRENRRIRVASCRMSQRQGGRSGVVRIFPLFPVTGPEFPASGGRVPCSTRRNRRIFGAMRCEECTNQNDRATRPEKFPAAGNWPAAGDHGTTSPGALAMPGAHRLRKNPFQKDLMTIGEFR